MSNQKSISDGLALVFNGISHLKKSFGHRNFTIDGRLVGDIGEIIAELEYELRLDKKSRKGHDAIAMDGKNVQIKATFKESLTFRSIPERYLGFKLFENGSFEEIYNGPGNLIAERYAHRKGIGEDLLSFPIRELRELSKSVALNERVPKKRNSLAKGTSKR